MIAGWRLSIPNQTTTKHVQVSSLKSSVQVCATQTFLGNWWWCCGQALALILLAHAQPVETYAVQPEAKQENQNSQAEREGLLQRPLAQDSSSLGTIYLVQNGWLQVGKLLVVAFHCAVAQIIAEQLIDQVPNEWPVEWRCPRIIVNQGLRHLQPDLAEWAILGPERAATLMHAEGGRLANLPP